MREDGVVSLWVGQADSPNAFDEYLQASYSADGDLIPSQFSMDFIISYYDDDFRESQYVEIASKSVRDLLKGHSYDDSIIDKFVHAFGESFPEPINAVLVLYNFRYGRSVEANTGGAVRMHYVGSVTLD